MENWNSFIGKKVKVKVAFAITYGQGGISPDDFCGVVKNISDDSIVLTDVKVEKIVGLKREIVDAKDILINKKYVIMLEEL